MPETHVKRRATPGWIARFSIMTPVFTVANLLTILRLILIPIFVAAIWHQRFLIALTVFITAAITDGLDGLVARAFNQKTPLGEVLDPLADKLLLVTAFITLSIPNLTTMAPIPPIPWWLTGGVIARDLLIVLGALGIKLTTGWNRFPPSIPGKINTLVQVLTIVTVLTAHSFPNQFQTPRGEYLLPGLYDLTLALAIISGLHYIYHVRNVRQNSATSR